MTKHKFILNLKHVIWSFYDIFYAVIAHLLKNIIIRLNILVVEQLLRYCIYFTPLYPTDRLEH